MTARLSKSKKRSVGSGRSRLLPEDFVLYLDENLCNSTFILGTLTKLGVRFERHLSHFSRGTLDENWLPIVGKNEWVLLTADKRIRYNLLEKRALEKNRVREFVFASGNMSGQEMAEALEQGIRKIIKMCSSIDPPFVAAITRSGEVHLRWPKR
jgi:hypothetical protein